MKIHVDQLSDEPRSYSFEADADWWLEREVDPGLREVLSEPVTQTVVASLMGASLYLEGRTESAFSLACSRCLERYRHPFSEPFRLVLEPAGRRVPSDPEGARQLAENGLYASDELEYGWFEGSELTLDDYFAELVALLVPVQPLCRDDCLGLCPSCGADRKSKACTCVQAPVNQPFAGLAALRDKLANG